MKNSAYYFSFFLFFLTSALPTTFRGYLTKDLLADLAEEDYEKRYCEEDDSDSEIEPLKIAQIRFFYLSYDERNFNKFGVHKDTGTEYNLQGWDWDGIHKDTGTKYDKKGFDQNGIHEDTGTEYNPEGYDKEGYDKKGYNQFGRDENGFFPANEMSFIYVRHMMPKEMRKKIPVELKGLIKTFFVGQSSFDEDGFQEKTRFNIFTLSEYSLKGYTFYGFDRDGYYRMYHKGRYDIYGFDQNGIHEDTGTNYDNLGFDRDHINLYTGTKYNPEGYDRGGQNSVNQILKILKNSLR